MAGSPQFALKWVSYEQNLKSFVGEIKGQDEFTDVTLVTGDGQQMDVHRMILSAFSPVLRAMFSGKKSSPTTLLYLRGVSSKCLGAIVDFMYLGEVNILEEDLTEFLAVAEEFQMKGLTPEEALSTTGAPQKVEDATKKVEKADNKDSQYLITDHKNLDDLDHHSKKLTEENYLKKGKEENAEEETKAFVNVDPTAANVSGAIISREGLEEMLSKSMVKVEGGFSCTNCDKQTFGSKHGRSHMKRHIETKHIAGLEFNCPNCGLKFTSRKSVACHVMRSHKLQ